ncbi:hypothetical protein E2C01_027687 [Portunus trituberculatus]|uniref:Uncharacterized protein n=1 Tax=Portunus trituberculatus TaxID=210409 RepID=A0A5B7EMN4_PORTR|nr:hypothetical protein [Portunus trituberculatus]
MASHTFTLEIPVHHNPYRSFPLTPACPILSCLVTRIIAAAVLPAALLPPYPRQQQKWRRGNLLVVCVTLFISSPLPRRTAGEYK